MNSNSNYFDSLSLDIAEGKEVQELKDTSLTPIKEPLIEVPSDVANNISYIKWRRAATKTIISWLKTNNANKLFTGGPGNFQQSDSPVSYTHLTLPTKA